MHLELVHSIPGGACLINVLVTNCILKRDNWKFITYITLIYGVFCWIYFHFTREQQYSFLDYTGTEAFLNLFWINLSAVFVYLIFCALDEKIKPVNDASSIYTYAAVDKRNQGEEGRSLIASN